MVEAGLKSSMDRMPVKSREKLELREGEIWFKGDAKIAMSGVEGEGGDEELIGVKVGHGICWI